MTATPGIEWPGGTGMPTLWDTRLNILSVFNLFAHDVTTK